ncbi:MAG: cystathionine beta-lyase [Pseudomonadota bacterium]
MKDKTKLIVSGRPHAKGQHAVNMPVERASTILFPTYDDYLEGMAQIAYGRLGTSTHRALEEAINVLEGGYETRLAPSGLQACTAAITAFVKAGDHVLITDSVYDPTRKFCDRFLKRFGVSVTYYDPMIGADIEDLVEENTKVIYCEAPGSLTFEVQDIPALAKVARNHGAKLIVDNTWSAGVYFKPLEHRAHVSIQAVTKYIVGHSDCLVGSITSCDEETAQKVFYALLALGTNVSADDAWIALRGIRTLSARLEQHQASGLRLARWLAKRPEVETVLHPALKSCPGHAIWKRDFTGATGLFSVVMKPLSEKAIRAFFNTLRLFGMGFSWGGFESLCIHSDPRKNRTATAWSADGPVFRFHAGLEDSDDLIADLERGFAHMNAAELDTKPKAAAPKTAAKKRKADPKPKKSEKAATP